MAHNWYTIQVYSGSEMSVKQAIYNIVKENKIEEKLLDIIVPTEDIIEIKKGEKKITEKPLYSGYIFANLDLDTSFWHSIQSLSRVSKFVGESKKPAPMLKSDIDKIIEQATKDRTPRHKITFDSGESVRIKDGPFSNFTGVVDEYDLEHGKLKINVLIFGRNTPVEILVSQVEKII